MLKKSFLLNFIIILIISAVLVLVALQLLGIITRHNQYYTVPNVIGKNYNDAIRDLQKKGFDVQIQDSVYVDSATKGAVLKQIPDPNSSVKKNRLIILTVNRYTLPLVEVPSLVGKSKDYAIELLQRTHLNLGDTSLKPDFMLGSVLEQRYNGANAPVGTKVPWGSKIDLVIGSGLSNTAMIVPDLIGLTYAEAKKVLQENQILLASTIADPDVVDSASAYVYKQSPPRYSIDGVPVYIQLGQLMDIWISKEMKQVKDSATNIPSIKNEVITNPNQKHNP